MQHGTDHMQPWLNHTGGLCDQLEKQYGQPIQVRVLDQGGPLQALSDEASHLPAPWDRESVWVRQVVLSVTEHPLLLARTVVPWSFYQTNQNDLDALATRPLGAHFLYDLPELKCSAPWIYSLDPDALLWASALHDPSVAQILSGYPTDQALKGRMRWFASPQCSLLLNELFLPTMPAFDCHV